MTTDRDFVDAKQNERRQMWRIAEALYYYNNEVDGDWSTEDPYKRSYYLKMATAALRAFKGAVPIQKALRKSRDGAIVECAQVAQLIESEANLDLGIADAIRALKASLPSR